MTGNYKNLSASALVRTGPGKLLGIFVASSTAGTVKLWDSLTAANAVIVNTTAAITAPAWIPIPFEFTTGLFVTIGGTADITVCFIPGG